jgi:putative FmdB family regulatory protein
MPTYEYLCTKCDHQFEYFQAMTDQPLKVCPKAICPQKKWGRGKVKKLIGAGAGLLFKGNGFYVTDYRSEGYKTAAKKETTPAPAATPAASASGSDAKPSSSAGSKTSSSPAKASSKSGDK